MTIAQRLHDALDDGNLQAARIVADDLECPETIADAMIGICIARRDNPLFGRHLLGNLVKARAILANE